MAVIDILKEEDTMDVLISALSTTEAVRCDNSEYRRV